MTKAMTASTIAEIFVQGNSVRVELEIGSSDLAAFQNVLPDLLYQRVATDPKPTAERHALFFRHDLRIQADSGPPLVGRVQQAVPRLRVGRDEITGEPLESSGNDGEAVVFVQLEYSVNAKLKEYKIIK